MRGIDLLSKVQNYFPDLPVVVMADHSSLESTVSAFYGGALLNIYSKHLIWWLLQ